MRDPGGWLLGLHKIPWVPTLLSGPAPGDDDEGAASMLINFLIQSGVDHKVAAVKVKDLVNDDNYL